MLKKQKGFTVVELMVALAVLGVFAALALPAFNAMIRNGRSAAMGEDFLYAFSYAKGEAIKRSGRVSICASSDKVTCTGEANWQVGFIVFVDTAATDEAPAAVIADPTAVLKVWDQFDTNAQIALTRGGAAAGFVRFNSLGVLTRNDANPVQLDSYITGCSGDALRRLHVNFAGQVRLEKRVCP